MEKSWKETPAFQPQPKSAYDKLQLPDPPRARSASVGVAKVVDIKPALRTNRQKLSHLIHCLAVAETQKMVLSGRIDIITRQKQDMDQQLGKVIKEKESMLLEQKSF